MLALQAVSSANLAVFFFFIIRLLVCGKLKIICGVWTPRTPTFVCMGMGGWWEEVEALLGRSHQLLSNGKTAHFTHWGTVLSEVYIASELSERKTPLSGTNGFNGKIRDIDTQSSFVGAINGHKK